MEPLQTVSPAAVSFAIEENDAEFLLALGRAGGGEERCDEHVHWTIGGSPIDYHNAVVRARLTQKNAAEVAAASREAMQRHAVPGSWHVGPSMQPSNLPRYLEEMGFSHGGDEPGMAVDLYVLPEPVDPPQQLEIWRVRDDAMLATWTGTLAQGFGEGEREAQWVAAMYRRLGLEAETPWRHYLGYLNGQPVATSTLFLGAGVAGIYFVMTVPQARRQGIGGAVTLAPLLEARDLGYRVGVLCSSPMGYLLYRRLGFETYCHIKVYEWHPPGQNDL